MFSINDAYHAIGLAMLPVALLAVACGDNSEASQDGDVSDRVADGPPVAAAPDTTPAAVWAHLQEEGYRDSWQLWPGTEELYPGTEPHGMLLTTYVNGPAGQGLADGDASSLPYGSIVVKENYMPDSTFAAATVMYRVEDYNPEHDDWLFAKFGPEGEAQAFGRAASCQACHQQASSGYLYTEVDGQ